MGVHSGKNISCWYNTKNDSGPVAPINQSNLKINVRASTLDNFKSTVFWFVVTNNKKSEAVS